jgi:hypothetical protein
LQRGGHRAAAGSRGASGPGRAGSREKNRVAPCPGRRGSCPRGVTGTDGRHDS